MPRSTTLTYPQTPINKVNRYNVRGTYDLAAIHSIINSSSVLHISLNAPGNGNPFPICLPMVGVAASYDHPSAGLDEVLDVYVHGYISARMMNLSRKANDPANDTVQAEGGANGVNGTEHEGLPVTVSATKVDGLVLSLTPYTHDINYRSATLFGHATVVSSQDEKSWAMERITNGVLTDRWSHTRVPPTSSELSSTAILKIKIVGGSGKVRVGGARDEDSMKTMIDEGDGKLWREKVWTGVVPVYECLGEPIWSGLGVGAKGEEVPEHVAEYVRETRRENEEYALNAIRDKSQDV